MNYCNGDDGSSAVVSVKCGASDQLEFIDESPAGVFNFNFNTFGACLKVCILIRTV